MNTQAHKPSFHFVLNFVNQERVAALSRVGHDSPKSSHDGQNSLFVIWCMTSKSCVRIYAVL